MHGIQTHKQHARGTNLMTITLTPEVENALAEQARQRGITTEQLAQDGLRYLFATPEPSEEEEEWFRVQAQLTLAQIDRLMEEMAREEREEDPEARRRERESTRAEQAASSAETRRLLDQISQLGQFSDNRASDVGVSAKSDQAWDEETEALRQENRRLCAEVGRKPGWLFGKIVTG